MKDLLVHYHIYKNAGSTIDNAIKKSLGKSVLLELDKDVRYKKNEIYDEELIHSIIEQGSECIAFSSHRMTPTVHRSDRYNFLPIVNIRHPLLRAGSVYRYERIRKDEKPGKEYAKELNFSDWLNWSLNQHGYIESRNYQTTLMSIPDVNKGEKMTSIADISVAKNRLDEMPVVGIVEYFDETCRMLEAYIGNKFPSFSIGKSHDNRTKEVSSWKAELKELQNTIPREVLIQFEEKNALDYEMFWYGVGKLRELEVPKLISLA